MAFLRGSRRNIPGVSKKSIWSSGWWNKKKHKFIEAIKTKLVHPQIEEGTAFLTDIRSNSFLISIDFFTAPIAIKEFQKLKQQKNLEILKLMEEMNIELAGASSDIKISGKLE